MELLGHRPAKIAWLGDPEDVSSKLDEAAVMQSAETLGIEVKRWEMRKADDLDRVLAAAAETESFKIRLTSASEVPAAIGENVHARKNNPSASIIGQDDLGRDELALETIGRHSPP